MIDTYSLIKLFVKKAYYVLGFFFMLCSGVYGQNQSKADSLELLYTTGNYEKTDRLELLLGLAGEHPNPDKALQFGEELLRSAKSLDSTRFIIYAYLNRGNSFRLKGDLSQSLESFFEGVKIAEEEGSEIDIFGRFYVSIASTYSGMGNNQNAVKYYKNGIKIFKEIRDTLLYATTLENLGDAYNLDLAKPDSALIFFKESGAIFKAKNDKIGMAYNLGNIGLAYAQLGRNKIAEKNISGAISLLEELGDYYPICVYLTYMSDMYVARGDWTAAFEAAQRSLQMARQYGLKEQISNAYLKLSELHEKRGEATKSLQYYKDHIAYKDSVKNITAVQQMANMQISQKQTEIDLKQTEVTLLNQQQKNQRNISLATAIALFLIAMLAFGLYRRYRFIRRTKDIIEQERNRSDSLLLNILPEETALELKENGKVQAKKFESVTVLFTDFEGFTNFAEKLSPEKLVESVDYYFSKFDEIIEKYDLEKIKTVGDSYMCAGGLPFPTEDHAFKMVQAAFEIAAFVKESKNTNGNEQTRFDIRIGINTGPVVAGVVGTKKFAYDIWGDAVNIASRMESNSEPGKINVSENTYEIIKDTFNCEYRGKIKAKNRGMMKMYFVNEAKPH